jgi:putative spermidine/putrescine transport system substrate-binding protein
MAASRARPRAKGHGADGFEVNKAGNFVPVIGKSATSRRARRPSSPPGTTTLSRRDTLAGNPPVEVVIPKIGVVAGVYVQAISAYAPHPNAAKLWMEYLYSDEGQLGWLKGYCHPIRFNAMVKAGKVPQEMLDALPPAAAYEKAIFPTLEQQDANKKAVTEGWDSVVGANVKE